MHKRLLTALILYTLVMYIVVTNRPPSLLDERGQFKTFDYVAAYNYDLTNREVLFSLPVATVVIAYACYRLGRALTSH